MTEMKSRVSAAAATLAKYSILLYDISDALGELPENSTCHIYERAVLPSSGTFAGTKP